MFQAFAIDAGVINGIASSDAKAVTLHREQNQPLIRLLTVNRIERDFNGSEKDEGVMTVPHVGFTIDVFFDDRGKAAIDPNSFEVTVDFLVEAIDAARTAEEWPPPSMA